MTCLLQVLIAQFEVLKDFTIRDERQATLEKKIAETEDNFAMAAKSLEREGTLRVKEAHLLEALDRHRSLEVQTTEKMRELRLLSTDF